MNNPTKDRGLRRNAKTWRQMKTKSNANENNRDITDAALRQQIQERAYYLWLENGCGQGDHERHWFEAERELMETAKPERKQRSDVRNGKNRQTA